MLKIHSLTAGGLAERYNLQPGDKIIEINGNPVSDIIDYRYNESDISLDLTVLRDEQPLSISIDKEIDRSLGIEFEADRIKRCKNNCIFCFCHNNPKQLRRTLYVKDDDYRHSFLYGSFVTLTNLSEDDIDRISRLRLSPLYVSVHATDPKVRQILFGRKQTASVLPLIDKLTSKDIQIHCQIVVVPGINDGEVLERTVTDLASYYPQVQSIAVVPVGLTKFSRPGLKTVGPKRALKIIDAVNKFRQIFGHRDNHFIYAADELYAISGEKIPQAEYYDDFPQIENGIGMVRDFLDSFPSRMTANIPGLWSTGKSMIKIWRSYVIPRYNVKLNLVSVANMLFGSKVTVSGLLCGKDIVSKIKKMKVNDQPLIIPPNCLNTDELFIDDYTIDRVEQETKREVIKGEYNMQKTLKMIQ